MKRTMKLKLMFITVIMLCSTTIEAQNTVKIIVENVPNSQGSILITTSNSHYAMAKAVKGTTEVELKDVPSGECMLYVMHDSNDDKSPNDMNGLPTEYVCMQKIDVKNDNQTITAKLQNIPEMVANKKK